MYITSKTDKRIITRHCTRRENNNSIKNQGAFSTVARSEKAAVISRPQNQNATRSVRRPGPSDGCSVRYYYFFSFNLLGHGSSFYHHQPVISRDRGLRVQLPRLAKDLRSDATPWERSRSRSSIPPCRGAGRRPEIDIPR